jgi:hypothetical protein
MKNEIILVVVVLVSSTFAILAIMNFNETQQPKKMQKLQVNTPSMDIEKVVKKLLAYEHLPQLLYCISVNKQQANITPQCI